MKYMSFRYAIIGGGVLLLLILLLTARLYLNIWLLDYVNDTLANIKGYQGSVEDINIDLYRSAYRIHNLKIFKKTGNIPTPFIAILDADLSIQWSALFHGRIVSDVNLTKPVINFAVAGSDKQTGVEADWTNTIKALTPIDINHVTFRQGKLTYQDFSSNPRVNIYIHNMEGEVRNLRNVVDKSHPLPSELRLSGDSIGNGKLQVQGRLNILKPVPDMDLDIKLENVSLPALNDYSEAYAAIDIRKGDLSVYSQFIIKNNNVSGYIKPIASHIALIDLNKSSNPIKVAWESVVSVIIEIFTNHPKDQFATKIKLEGRLDNISTDTWSAISGIVRNAFISAFKKGFDKDDSASSAEPAHSGN